MKKLLSVVISFFMIFLLSGAAAAEPAAQSTAEGPEGYTQVKVYEGTYGFGPAEITAYTNDDFSRFFFYFNCFGEDQEVEGTIEDGIVTVEYDLSGFMGGDAQAIWDDAVAAGEAWEPLAGAAETDAAQPAAEGPEGYTQVKVYEGTYGFGPAEITAYTNDDFSRFFFYFNCFGEDQEVEGTIEDGIVTVEYDLSGFMGGDAQAIWDDAVAAGEAWEQLGKTDGNTPAASDTEAEEEEAALVQDLQDYLWNIPEDASEEEYISLMERNYRIIQAFELLFTKNSYAQYSDAYNKQYKRTKNLENAQLVVEKQDSLILKTSIADGAWILWGADPQDNPNGYGWLTDCTGPVMDEEKETLTEEALDASMIDGYGQGPVLIKCLLENPAEAKGNVILISGGGFYTRSNAAEGYAAIPVFQNMGYNCFLLQRRVAPYSTIDIFMDLQRAIRLVRNAAEEEGWGGRNMIAAAGFSGGGGTILGTINHCYGSLTPADYGVSGYITDNIDEVDSDLDVAMIIYGAAPETTGTSEDADYTYGEDYDPVNPDNPKWPAFYICHGMEDVTVPVENAQILYEYVKDTVPAELYLVPDAKHGFGPGTSDTAAEGCRLWPGQADEFMQELIAPYTTEELILKNGDLDIYGKLMIPAGQEGAGPAVIISHGFGGTCLTTEPLAQYFAEQGYVAYVFDFIGGSKSSQSGKADGDMTGMSVLTEASDLSAVMDQIRELPCVDPENVFLLGQSQGGYVSAYVAAQRPEDVKALVLMFPAFALQDDCWERHGSIENVPETEDFMGSTLGSVYSLDAMSLDIYDVIGNYKGDVLICHGDQDPLVNLSYSERAAEVYENADLHIYEGAAHVFAGADLTRFEEEALSFMNSHR